MQHRKSINVKPDISAGSGNSNPEPVKSTETVASEGVFYVVRDINGWKLIAYRYHVQTEELDHTAFWEQKVAPFLAFRYRLKRSMATELALHPYGFPRGRVAKTDQGFMIYHGNDFLQLISKIEVEQKFAVHGKARWQPDDHEHCMDYDTKAIVRLLGIKKSWSSTR